MVQINGVAGWPVLTVDGKQAAAEILVRGVRFGGKGGGLVVSAGPKLHLQRVMLAGVTTAGVGVHGKGAALQAEFIVITGTLPKPGSTKQGWGLDIDGHA